jgi:hypothetical protein
LDYFLDWANYRIDGVVLLLGNGGIIVANYFLNEFLAKIALEFGLRLAEFFIIRWVGVGLE